jgi:hypothetical protein
MSKKTFSYSESEIIKRKNILIAFILGLPMVILPFIFSSNRWKEAMIVAGILLCLLVFFFLVMMHFLIRSLRQRQLTIEENRLVVKHGGAIVQEIRWDGVITVKKHLNPLGELRAIDLTSSSTKPFCVGGFESLSTIMQQIESHLPPGTRIVTKQTSVEWENPILLYSVVVTGGVLLGILYRTGGSFLFQNIVGVYQLCFGGFLLFYAPISRQNPKSRKWELLLGGLMIGSVLLKIVAVLLNIF